MGDVKSSEDQSPCRSGIRFILGGSFRGAALRLGVKDPSSPRSTFKTVNSLSLEIPKLRVDGARVKRVKFQIGGGWARAEVSSW